MSGRIPEPLRTLSQREVPLGFPDTARLRLDVDHAVGGLGAVQRRRCGPLDHLDALDHRRVEVVDPGNVPAAALHAVVDANTVDVDEWSVVHEPHRRAAADLDRGRGAGVTRALLHDNSGQATPQKVRDVGDRLKLRDPCVEHRDGVTDLAYSARCRCARHDECVQLERLLTEEDVLNHGLSGTDGHRDGLRPIA